MSKDNDKAVLLCETVPYPDGMTWDMSLPNTIIWNDKWVNHINGKINGKEESNLERNNMESEDKKDLCVYCDRMKRYDDKDGFGFIHKSLLVYDEEDIAEYVDSKGCVTLCNKCDDYFGDGSFDTAYENECARIKEKLKVSEERFNIMADRYKALVYLSFNEDAKQNDKLMKLMENDHKIFIACMEWLGLPQYHVKIKRLFR